MIKPKEFLRKVVGDEDLFTTLYVVAEEKVLRVQPKGNEFGVGFLMGFWLGRMYGNEEMHKSVCTTKNSNRNKR